MKQLFSILSLLLQACILIVFTGKILYLLFKPKFLAAYTVFTDKKLSDFSLGLYYLLIVLISLKTFAGILDKLI
jgi:hypothetical protein